ncbi:hypothetical protein JOF53_001689 [Crossiella equi]|uniref:HSP18 transcriptional regulator n=1 Tax=Crossiella equi TaxID=130796 RepID=A0ABS5A961_9PSEU|nr:HSP18 transcriptional regulator [Crossiella equi]MBP2472817.1 hypothetical protein [Crossiella equi]
MDETPESALEQVRAALTGARAGQAKTEQLLLALTALRLLRDELATWEPELITAARGDGASWAALAPALGVASRQAAERRFLRLRPSAGGETTGEARVEAERDRRAGDRAVTAWARANAAALRSLAGQVSRQDGLSGAAREHADRVGAALGENDTARLLPELLDAGPHLTGELAERVDTISAHTTELRRGARRRD